ncbi:MAG: sensor histidine kinase [Anaerolineae bacterium]|nr:sensor histidine kinase [Anaerolineae bacterium]
MDRVIEWITARLARQQVVAYALLDGEFQVLEAHGLENVVDPVQGGENSSLWEHFPALIGLEDRLHEIVALPEGVLEIPQIISRQPDGTPIYYNLRVEAIHEFGARLLIFALDTTEQSSLEQQLVQQRNELRLNIEARQRAEAALRQARDELEIRVRERTLELEDANLQLQALPRRLVDVQENERREIARELHDEIGQVLTGLNLLLKMSTRLPAETARHNMEEARGLVHELMKKVRQLSLDLRPAMLDDLGLLPALLWHFDRFTAQTQIEIQFKHAGIDRRFSSEVEITAYRIIQEALTNAARYADVREISVRVILNANALGIQIDDRGKGFSPEAVHPQGVSVGLASMRERVASLNGSISLDAALGEGVHIHAHLPIRE